jgi:GMP reductase
MRIISEEKLGLDDVLLVPQRNTLESRSQVELEREYKFYHSPRVWKGIPFFAANLACLAGTELGISLSKHKICTALHKFHSNEELIALYNEPHEEEWRIHYIWPSIGMKDDDIRNLKDLTSCLKYSPNIVIDVPNGHIEKFVHFCAKVRNEFPDAIIMGGNVVTPEACTELIIHGGLDIVKIQIGSGKLCTTRLQTGVGYGNLSCTMECAGVHGLKSGERKLGLICSDGGLNNTGDCAKMYAAGADFLMSGSLFYGVDEACGEWECEQEIKREIRKIPIKDYKGWRIGGELDNCAAVFSADISTDEYSAIIDGKWYVNGQKKRLKIYGMSSKESQEKHYGEYKKYRASEGRSQYADYNGKADDVVQELLGGLRSTATYIGANSLKDFNKCAVFCKVNQIHRNMIV